MSHLQYSIISNNKCNYKVIPDKNFVKKVENKNDNILNCNKNNNSKICPVLICNDDQDKNNKIFNRNFSSLKLDPIPPYRSNYSVCRKYKDMNDIDDIYKSHKNTIIGNPNVNSNLFPGKAPASGYFRNIDIESNLKRLDTNNSACPKNLHNPELCKKIVSDNPALLDRPMCQNYKYTSFTDNSEFYKYKNKCKNIQKKVRGYTCKEQINDIREKSQLQFNYNKRKDKTCNTGCLPPISNKLEVDQPLLYGNRTNMSDKPILQIGPERQDHLVENLWNNVSKRKYIYKKH